MKPQGQQNNIIIALCCAVVGLVALYLNERGNASQGLTERARIEEFNRDLLATRNRLVKEILEREKKVQFWKAKKQRLKIIYYEIPGIIDSLSGDELDERFRANGFSPVFPCK